MAKTTVAFKVDGMSCDACVRTIERKLSRVSGVESASVDLGSGNATVRYEDSKAAPEQLIAAVEQIGYHATRA